MTEPAFRILGNLEVAGRTGPVAVGGRRRRALLAHLLVHTGRRLSLDSICDAVWDGEPPAGAPSTVRTYLSQFRKLDGDGAGLLIEPNPSGYLVTLDRGKLDATAFEDRLDAALQAADPSERLEHLEAALALWRGSALAEFADSDWASAEAQRLRAQRQVAIAARFDALLALGRHDECVGDLDVAVAASPFDERLAARLALARYRSGRPSDALSDLAALRRRLVDELGLSPGAEVTDLERRILDHDPSLAHTPIEPEPASATEETGSPSPPTSTELPDGTVTFLFTDLEGSTRMLHQLGAEAYAEVLGNHRSLISDAVIEHGGVVFGSEGDALFCAFSSTPDAVSAASDAQHALRTADWPLPVRVRMGLHTGEALVVGDNYVGSTVHVVARIAATGHGGQVVASDACRSLAPDASWLDLDTHRLKDVERAQRLHQLVVDRDDAFPPLATTENVPTNLPESVDDFVGRSDDVAALTAQLTDARLVTLAGPGGVGKTRLAIETASESRAAHPGGVHLVELARLGAGGDVAGSVLRTLVDAGGRGDDLPSVLADLTGDSSTLLLFDNCEHVVEATAALIDGILASHPNLRVLATSREPLRVRGEHVRQVAPLSTSSKIESDAGSGRSPAEQLFITRTEAATGRPVNDADAAIVRRICDDLDGLPLAIELAASRTTSLALVDIAERLENRFALLRSTRSGDDARHRTLAGVVDWSYELLSSPDRLLFNRLAVFADPFTLGAAEAVGAGGSIDTDAVLDGLANLVNKSLVQLTTIEGVPAYRMLGTLRAYGRRRLEEADALDEAERRFTNWAVGVTAGLERDMRTARQDAALRDVIVHRGNLRFAHELLLEAGHVVDALRIVTSAPIDIPAERARLIDLLMPLVEADEGINEATRANVLGRASLAASNLEFERGEFAAGVDHARRAGEVFRQLGDESSSAWASFLETFCAWGTGDLDGARAAIDAARAGFAAIDDRVGAANAAWAAILLDPDLDRADELGESAEVELRSIDSPFGLAHCLESRALVDLQTDRVDQAATRLAEALGIFTDLRTQGCLAHCLEAIAACVAASESSAAGRTAGELLGAAESLRVAGGHRHRPWELGGQRAALELSRQTLSEQELDAAMAAGRAHELSSATDLALRALGAQGGR